MDKLNTVNSLLDEDTILMQLAEEASELAQAALKLIRSKEPSINPTPISESKARQNLIEEFSDVLLVAAELNIQGDIDIMEHKEQRWIKRIVNNASHQDTCER